jgi:hypothetical protein
VQQKQFRRTIILWTAIKLSKQAGGQQCEVLDDDVKFSWRALSLLQ